MDEEKVKQIIKEELDSFFGFDRYTFQKNLKIFDGRNIQIGRTVGTKIGTATDQKIAVYGETPVVQAGAISPPSGGNTVDAQARAAINSILTALAQFGITA